MAARLDVPHEYGHVLVCIDRHSDIRLNWIADLMGIGEPADHSRAGCSARDGCAVRKKEGGRNTSSADHSQPLRLPLESEHTIGESRCTKVCDWHMSVTALKRAPRGSPTQPPAFR
jgi:hypothetical protein